MILDSLQMFDNAASVAIAVGTQASTNVLDYGVASGIPSSANGGGARDMGIGDAPALKLLVIVTTAFASAASAGTMSVTFQGAVDNASGAPAAFSSWFASPVYTTAQLKAGARLLDIDFPRPPAGVAVPRFCRLLYTVAAATMTAGNVSAFVVLDRDDQMYQSTDNSIMGGYAAGITISN